MSGYPYVAGEGTRLFDDVPKSYRLDLISSKRRVDTDDQPQSPPLRGGIVLLKTL
jgi:hypothetical protein